MNDPRAEAVSSACFVSGVEEDSTSALDVLFDLVGLLDGFDAKTLGGFAELKKRPPPGFEEKNE